jgi:anthranilate synthase component 1
MDMVNNKKYSLSFKEFVKVVERNFIHGKTLVIPIYKEIVVDTDTPLSVFLKIYKPENFNFLLESVEQKENIGRYSFLGTASPVYMRGRENFMELYVRGCIRFKETEDPLGTVKEYMNNFQAVNYEGLPSFWGGLVGYVSYNLVSMYEPVPPEKPDYLEVPEIYFFLVRDVLAFDNINRTLKIISCAFITEDKFNHQGCSLEEDTLSESLKSVYEETIRHIESIEKELCKTINLKTRVPLIDFKEVNLNKWHSNMKKGYFLSMVNTAKKYIEEGDIIQVVLSQKFHKITDANPIDIYRAMRVINPSPYLFYLDFQDLKLIGSSPEILVSVRNGKILTKPIAGTRPIGKTPEENEKLKNELLADEKERAEHLMLVDLARNDVGRVAKAGSVKVDKFMYVENYSHVMHIVSDVSGDLREDLHPLDVLKAVFPVGTVSGAPKIRAMQIIEELEPERRGIYAGAVGYMSFDGNLDTAIVIRTAVMKGRDIFVQAGAGIVADSIPEREYEETINKAKALIKAIEVAENMENLDC